jgi:hypothetical protein
MTTTDPIVAVTFGLAVLGEGVLLGWTDSVGMLLSGAVAVGGVVILSKYHPEAQHNQIATRAAEAREDAVRDEEARADAAEELERQ